MTALQIGAHVDQVDPLAEAKARDTDLVQFFLGDPQDWRETKPHYGRAEALRSGPAKAHLHPCAVPDQRGHHEQQDPHPEPQDPGPARRGGGRDRGRGADRPRRPRHGEGRPRAGRRDTGARRSNGRLEGGFGLPILIENTAGGDHAMARRLERIGAAVGRRGGSRPGSSCFRHGHAWARRGELFWTRSTGSRRSPAASTWCTPTTARTPSTPAVTGTISTSYFKILLSNSNYICSVTF